MAAGRRRLFILAGMVIALLVAAIAWRNAVPSEDDGPSKPNLHWTESTGFVQDAQLQGFQPTDATLKGPRWGAGRALLNGHDITRGAGIVIYLRRFGDDVQSHDEETFEMLTLELGNPAPGAVYRFGDSGIRGFYSEGSAVWGIGSYVSALKGEVRVTGLSAAEIIVAVDIEGPLIRSHENRHFGWEVMKLKRELRCSQVPVEVLTAWQRGQSADPYSNKRK